MSFIVQDCNEALIEVGMRVLYGAPDPADREKFMVEVTEISEPDADYDDELGRGVEYCPQVTVKFFDGEIDKVRSYNTTVITWADYPNGPDKLVYTVDDLEVVS